MIFGIGTDIVELDRVKNLSNLDKFSKKILSTNEINHFKTLNSEERIRYLAKQFVAKESVAKAIRQGFNKKIKISSIDFSAILTQRGSVGSFKPSICNEVMVSAIILELKFG